MADCLSANPPCMIKFNEYCQVDQVSFKRSLGGRIRLRTGNCQSLFVRLAPALFTHTVEYLRPGACIHKAGRCLTGYGFTNETKRYIKLCPQNRQIWAATFTCSAHFGQVFSSETVKTFWATVSTRNSYVTDNVPSGFTSSM